MLAPVEHQALLRPAADDNKKNRNRDVEEPLEDEIRHMAPVVLCQGVIETFIPTVEVDAYLNNAHGAADNNDKHDPGIPALGAHPIRSRQPEKIAVLRKLAGNLY